jgi:hypothetical protein
MVTSSVKEQPMNTTVRKLKARNNHAAALLVIGDQEEAYEELRSAVAKTVFSLGEGIPSTVDRPTEASHFPCRLFTILPLTTRANGIGGASSSHMNQAAFPWPMLSLASNDETETEYGSASSGSCRSTGCTTGSSATTTDADSISLVAAASLYNMGLACHATYFTSPWVGQQDRLLHQAELHYLQAYELSLPFDAEILKLGLSMNLMEVAYERGDLTALHTWSTMFCNQTLEMKGSYPDEVLQGVLSSHLYFTRGLQAARAA